MKHSLRESSSSITRSVIRLALVAPARASLRAQVLIGAALYAIALVVLVALGISGSSSGIMYRDFFTGADPQHVLLPPRAIRSDEYFVATPLVISQVQQGLPRFSHVLPGGVDMSVLWDMPYREWSALLRPQNWGFFFLPLDNAFALRWWLPALALGAASYFLLVTLWRKPLAALAASVAFVFSPFFQWWYGAGTFWPPVFGVVIMLSTVWILRARRARVRWAIGAATAYTALVAGVALYPAFLIPCILAGTAGAVGWFVSGPHGLSWRSRFRRWSPIALGAVVAVLVVIAYAATRRTTLETITSTVYPGQRSWPPGNPGSLHIESVLGGVFGQGLRSPDLGAFASNPSEGASFLFVGLYLLPVALWLVWDRWRGRRRLDGVVLGPLACLVVLVAFIYVPGWDLLSRALLLGMTTPTRVVLGIGLVSFLLLAVVVHRLVESRRRPPVWILVASVGVVAADHLAVLAFLRGQAPAVLAAGSWWPGTAGLLLIAVALYSRGRATVPSILVLAVTMVVSGWVNPIYRGVLDLRTSAVAHAVFAIERADPGAWIGTGERTALAVLRETAVKTYSGTQGWPTEAMWSRIDPGGAHADMWNRYAHVLWTDKESAPDYALPAPDTIVLRLDTCSTFVQKNVAHLLTQEPLEQPCARLRTVIPEPTSTYRIYDVVPASS